MDLFGLVDQIGLVGWIGLISLIGLFCLLRPFAFDLLSVETLFCTSVLSFPVWILCMSACRFLPCYAFMHVMHVCTCEPRISRRLKRLIWPGMEFLVCLL